MVPLPTDEFVARFRANLTPEMAVSFTSEQIAAIEKAFGQRYRTQHLVALRPVFPLPWGRYYMALYIGRDRRKRNPRRMAAAFAMGLALSFAACGMIGAAALHFGWHLA